MSKPRHELTDTKLLSIDLIEREPLIETRIEPVDRHFVQAIGWSIRNGISPPPILVYAVGPRRGKRFLLYRRPQPARRHTLHRRDGDYGRDRRRDARRGRMGRRGRQRPTAADPKPGRGAAGCGNGDRSRAPVG